MKLIKRRNRLHFFCIVSSFLFSLLLTVQARADTLLSANFDVNTDGFTYSDDTFRGTNTPNYSKGNHSTTGGFSGGRVNAFLGGVDNISVLGMSGGWSRSFVVSGSGTVNITLKYLLYFISKYEGDECGQALVAIDGNLVSDGPEDFLEEFCGASPNLPSDQDSGWQEININLNLTPGAHTITLGGWNDKKDASNEFTNILFDDIVITQGPTPTPTPAPTPGPGTIFSDDFSDGNANGWTVINDSGKASNWQVVSGKYNQLNGNIGTYTQSFLRGSYSRYDNGFGLTDYEVTAEINSSGGGNIGVMFRYQNNNNYYRFSVSANQGFSRLEKKVNGVFTPIASDGRGPALNQTHIVTIDVDGSKILVYLNGEPLFSVADSSIGSGTVALFAQSNAVFDNVVVTNKSSVPKVVISSLVSYSVQTIGTINVSAVARNVPSGGGVRFVLDGGAYSFTDLTEPYSGQFSNVSQGNHQVVATIVNSLGTPVSGTMAQDTNLGLGIRGNHFIAMGDSITNGSGDDFSSDNNSLDGRNLNRGYTPILNDLLSGTFNRPMTVVNEGLGGTKSGSGSGNGVNRVNSTKARHTGSQYWLVLFGTNDSGSSLPVPSGKDCTEADLQAGKASCKGTYKDSMRNIIKNLKGSGKVALLAKVPFISNAPASRDQLIKDYNTVIGQLVVEQIIPATPPDFYSYYKQNPGQLFDGIHPNGSGYISMANLWFDALVQSGILN